jgi:hypothetical protein
MAPYCTDQKGRQTRPGKGPTPIELGNPITAEESRPTAPLHKGIAAPTAEGLALIESVLVLVTCGPCSNNIIHGRPCRGYNCTGGVCQCSHGGAGDGR